MSLTGKMKLMQLFQGIHRNYLNFSLKDADTLILDELVEQHEAIKSTMPGQSLVLLFFLSVTLVACRDNKADYPLSIDIDSPVEGSFFLRGEPIAISIKVHASVNYKYMEIYHNNSLVGETSSNTFDTLLRVPTHNLGDHQVKVLAFDKDMHVVERVSRCEIVDVEGESGDLVSFSEGAPLGWFLSGWTATGVGGFNKGAALKSSGDYALAITRKNLMRSGHISFYVGNSTGNLEFYVDGKLRAKWFGHEGLSSYSYSLGPGEHICKWISRGAGVYLDEVLYTPGVVKHSLGEYFGGGIVFHLDSAGEHGLISAHFDGKNDGRREIPWGCQGLKLTWGNRAESQSDGENNTLAITQGCEWENCAARYCLHLEVSEDEAIYDDWYLPAIAELGLLYRNRAAVGNLDGEYYWSSTSFSIYSARVINFFDGSYHGANRDIPMVAGPVSAGIYVRAVRKF